MSMADDIINVGERSGEEESMPENRSGRGFAAMDPERQREIASAGGKAAHAKGTAHQWTSEEAREAGREGGRASRGGARREEEQIE